MSAEPVIRHDAANEPLLDGRFQARPEAAPEPERRFVVPLSQLRRVADALLSHRGRVNALFVTDRPERSLVVAFALRGELRVVRAPLPDDRAYPTLSLASPACALPERELHDRHGLEPLAHPDPEAVLHPDADQLRRAVRGRGTFVIPYGPIRSGIFEAIQFVIETGGEDVLQLEVRPFFKHRGMEARFAGVPVEQGAAIAERVAAIAGVAHALAFAEAIERAAGARAPERARLWRVVHAELERIANHLDVAARLAEDAALSVGVARFTILKEQVMRLRATLCGSRFGRGVVVPGGIAAEPLVSKDSLAAGLTALERDLSRDRTLLVRTASFTDRLIGSGTLDRETVEAFAGVGPVARACGVSTDARLERPYAAYDKLGWRVATAFDGDAMARLDVRLREIAQSVHLIRQALGRLPRTDSTIRAELAPSEGVAFGWSEAPQGELLYRVALAGDRIGEVRISSPSLRNWPLFAESFRGDVLTDFSFIEHSFGLTPAGADR